MERDVVNHWKRELEKIIKLGRERDVTALLSAFVGYFEFLEELEAGEIEDPSETFDWGQNR